MSKTKRQWIQLSFTHPDALRAYDVPYDATWSVYDAINNMAMPGLTGVRGPTGAQGATGMLIPYGPTGSEGPTGIQGPTGVQGFTGLGVAGLQGQTGLSGNTGAQGQTGLMGPAGLTGSQGAPGITGADGAGGLTGFQGGTGYQGITGVPGISVTGVQGPTGVQGQTGVGLGATGLQGGTGVQGTTGAVGNTGSQGQTGIQGIGITGPQGFTGLGANPLPVAFNPISRYAVVDTPGEEVWLVSSSTVFNNLSWDRTGTTLNIYRDSHGHAIGNEVVVRNTNMDYQEATIDSTTLNSFSITTTASDGLIGTAGAYGLGFTFTNIGSGGTLYAPSGDHADCQLLSMRIRTGSSSTTYDLVVPTSAINGAGSNTSLNNCYMPDFNVRGDQDSLPAVAATMQTNIGGSYSTFRFGNLGGSSRFILVHF